VTKFQVGDRVAACFFQGWPAGRLKAEMHRTVLGGSIDGVLVEQAKFREDGLVHLPENYSFEEGSDSTLRSSDCVAIFDRQGQLVPGETFFSLDRRSFHGSRLCGFCI
jgi:NADPH:quinone reductase-like Zn-dependent oxidoreductase